MNEKTPEGIEDAPVPFRSLEYRQAFYEGMEAQRLWSMQKSSISEEQNDAQDEAPVTGDYFGYQMPEHVHEKSADLAFVEASIAETVARERAAKTEDGGITWTESADAYDPGSATIYSWPKAAMVEDHTEDSASSRPKAPSLNQCWNEIQNLISRVDAHRLLIQNLTHASHVEKKDRQGNVEALWEATEQIFEAIKNLTKGQDEINERLDLQARILKRVSPFSD